MNQAHPLRMKKPQKTPTYNRYFGRFKARTAWENTSMVQVIKLVSANRINRSWVICKTVSLSVRSRMITSETPITQRPTAIVTVMQ